MEGVIVDVLVISKDGATLGLNELQIRVRLRLVVVTIIIDRDEVLILEGTTTRSSGVAIKVQGRVVKASDRLEIETDDGFSITSNVAVIVIGISTIEELLRTVDSVQSMISVGISIAEGSEVSGSLRLVNLHPALA